MRVISTTFALVALSPGLLLACPVCGLADATYNRGSYITMSVMLSVLPLGMMAGIVFWIYRRSTTHSEAAEIPPSVLAPVRSHQPEVGAAEQL